MSSADLPVAGPPATSSPDKLSLNLPDVQVDVVDLFRFLFLPRPFINTRDCARQDPNTLTTLVENIRVGS